MTYTEQAMKAVQEVTAGSAVLIDVRRDDEWEAVHARGATHWALSRLEHEEMPDIAHEKRIFVHCAAGKRAEVAKEILRMHGWADVTNIGGLSDWQEAGGEIE